MNDTGGRDRDTHEVLMKARSLLERRGLMEGYGLDIRREGRWFVLEGQVDTQRTKSKIFNLLPEEKGARWIVDRVSTVPPPPKNTRREG